MSRRGPKPRTATNSSPARAGFVRGAAEPPSELNESARLEFDRLVGVLHDKGTLDRVDVSVVAECARIKDVLDRAYAAAPVNPELATVKLLGLLTSQRRGLLRELGLTTSPSRSVVRAKDASPETADPVGPLIKIAPTPGRKGG